MTTNKNAQLDDALYTQWYESIMAGLEAGVAPWVKPWNAGGIMPCNATTGREYNGLNVFYLMMVQDRNGWSRSRWLTPGSAIKLARKRGLRVNFKGQKTTTVTHFRPIFAEDKATGERRFVRFKTTPWKLLNVDQIKGLPEDIADGPKVEALPETARIAKAEAFYAALTGDVRHGGARAFYSPASDHIGMPEFASFQDAVSYYATLGHEYVHWSGHESRLKRPIRNSFGSADYAKEELVAEFGAAFLCAHLGLAGKLQHPEYIGSWLKVLKGDKGVALHAAQKAQGAARFLLEAGGLVEPYQNAE